jgi:TolB-like protein
MKTLTSALIGVALLMSTALVAQSTDTVTVTPFVNLSAQPSDDWIGAGIAETVASDLERRGMTVIGEESGAHWRVVGTYQRIGDLVRITARLIEAETGAVRQSGTVDGTLTALFELQDQIVPTLSGEVIPVLPTDDNTTATDITGVLELENAVAPNRNENRSETSGGFSTAPLEDRPRAIISRTTEPPRIDGRLDDVVWETATHITEFVQIAPVAGAPGTEATEVWMAYDSDNMYFAFYAHYRDPSMMRVNRTDRDQSRGDDEMAVLFDTFLDQQRAYQFSVSGYGVQGDSLVNADGSTGRRVSSSGASQTGTRSTGSRRSGGGSSLMSSGSFGIPGDSSWNTLFETGGQIVDDGWTAEMSIPFKSLRYPARAAGDPHRWGFQITRRIRGRSEAQSWAPIAREIAGQLTQFGILDGLEGLSQSRNLEILPEVTGVSFGSLARDTGDYNQRDPEGDIGLGFKYGITPNLTADLTYNPDFSQIESDRPQIETNQRFALFYPEQRPFFLEGQDIFQTSTPLSLLHTRTIVDPRFGGKLTGKVGKSTLGFIVADDEAAGRLDNLGDSRFGSTAQTVVGRARYDFYSESYLGAIMTAREFGQDYNRVGGIDGRFRLGQTHRLSFLAVASSTQDELEGTLNGPAIEADLTRQGRNLGYNVSYSSIDPEFRTESGFLPRVDLRQTSGTVSYRWWPESSLSTWGPSFSYLRLYDHTGQLQDEQILGQTSFQFRNNMLVSANVSRDLERFREIDFRRTGYGFYSILVSTPLVGATAGFNWGDGIFFSDSPFLGRSMTGNFLLNLRPNSRLGTRLTGVFSRFVNPTNDLEVFDVQIYRLRTTFQFTDRFLLRHIMEHNTMAMALGNNVLLTYRVNAGTVAFLGYDDRYQRGTRIDNRLFPTTALRRTNHAFFAKMSYLFRY